MDITKQITVIDKEKIKVGDMLKITRRDIKFENTVLAIEVTDTYLIVKFDSGIKCKMDAKELTAYDIEKVGFKTSNFAIGQLYRVEDTYSCNKFDVLIMTVSDSEITAMKLKSALAMSIKESEIDTRYKFSEIKTVVKSKEYDTNLIDKKLEFDKTDVDEIIKDIFRAVYLGKEFDNDESNQSKKHFFTGYRPSFYFKTDGK